MDVVAALLFSALFGGLFIGSLTDDGDDGPDTDPTDPVDPTEPTVLEPGDGSYTGTDGADAVTSQPGFTGRVDGGNGNDTLVGVTPGQVTGADLLTDPGGNTAWYGTGPDGFDGPPADSGVTSLIGGAGNDDITGTGGGLYVDGGAGADHLHLGGMTKGIVRLGEGDVVDIPQGDVERVIWHVGERATLDLGRAGDGHEVLSVGHGAAVTGSAHDDVIHSSGGDQTLLGGAGNDLLDSRYSSYWNANTHSFPWDRVMVGDGNDVMTGGDGDDTLLGDLGDTLTGGAGSDRFEVNVEVGSVAHVTDYDPASDSLAITVNAAEARATTDISAAVVDGNTVLSIGGQPVMVIEGRTDLSFAINREETGDQIGDDTGYADLDGRDVDPASVDIVIGRYTTYA